MPLVYGPLVWADEFDEEELDPRKWMYEPTASMAPQINEELQKYTGPSRYTSEVRDGVLRLTAKRVGRDVLSARVSTYGKFSFTYGVVEARLKVPWARGFWPAFWMLGNNIREVGWPACGEVDIMEVFGHRRGKNTCSTVHNPEHSWGTKDPLDGGCASLEAPDPDWHVWKLLWTPDSISFYMDDDDDPIFTYERTVDIASADTAGADQYPYTSPQYFILNLAVGGNGPSEPVDDVALTAGVDLFVDYVRVYALSDDAPGVTRVVQPALSSMAELLPIYDIIATPPRGGEGRGGGGGEAAATLRPSSNLRTANHHLSYGLAGAIFGGGVGAVLLAALLWARGRRARRMPPNLTEGLLPATA